MRPALDDLARPEVREVLRLVWADPMALEGLMPAYAIPNVALDHVPVRIGLPTGRMRANAHGYTAFMVESFVDEVARREVCRQFRPEGSGGGILNTAGGLLTVTDSTIADNVSMRAGGGVEDNGSTTALMKLSLMLKRYIPPARHTMPRNSGPATRQAFLKLRRLMSVSPFGRRTAAFVCA